MQETWLAWSGRSGVENPRAYLVRIAVNAALARRTTINRRKEEYVGPWLPEPVVTPIDPVERAEAVSLAMLVVLETLTPLERAVFVLHEVFGYAHPEIAEIVDRTPVGRTATRAPGQGARAGAAAALHRGSTGAARGDAAVHRRGGRWGSERADGGARARRDAVGRWWRQGPGGRSAAGAGAGQDRSTHHRRRAAAAGASLGVRYRTVNGDPSALLLSGDTPFAVIVLEVEGDQVTGIYAVTNPDKLARLAVD